MYKILIDTTERYKKSAKLVEFNGSSEKLVAEKAGDLDVVVTIKELLDENNLKVSDIDLIEPNLGPGSFTGLKIGVTIANIFNWATGKKDVHELYIPEYGAEPNIHQKIK